MQAEALEQGTGVQELPELRARRGSCIGGYRARRLPLGAWTQRAQYSLTKEYTLNYINAPYIERPFPEFRRGIELSGGIFLVFGDERARVVHDVAGRGCW